MKAELIKYEWDPKSEVATLVYAAGDSSWTETRSAPLPTPTPDEAAAGYVRNLMFWLSTQGGAR